MIRVGVTGGIGSGKSTLCRLFAQRGVAVYDSDREARRLMTDDAALRSAVAERFGADIYVEGALDRPRLAAVAFADPRALADLNALVHPAVMRDFAAWTLRQKGPYVVLECAVLFEAGLESQVDRTVAVLAPAPLRLERAMRRDRCDEERIRRRMAVQLDDDTLAARADYAVVNILESDLESAVAELDRIFRLEAADET